VKLIAYTRILHADTTQLTLAEEHRDTDLPERIATLLSDTNAVVARARSSKTAARWPALGRPTTPFRQTITDFVRAGS